MKQENMNLKNRIWKTLTLLMPAAGFVFLLYYMKSATVDVVYSDYIRLINSYLPDTLSKESFFVSDILTRIPVTFPLRWINVSIFGYSVDFDRILGIFGIFIMMLILGIYIRRERLGMLSLAALMLVGFSLNKWELLINGSGYPHFLSYGLFFYNYLVLERVFTGTKQSHDEKMLVILPFASMLAAGPYIVQYCMTLIAAYIFVLVIKNRNMERKNIPVYITAALLPMLLFLLSNSTAEYEHNVSKQLTLLQVLIEEPGFTAHFILNGFASEILCGNLWEDMLNRGTIGYGVIYLTGALVMLAYTHAVFLYFSKRIYHRTVFPLMLILSGLGSHVLVFLSRYLYLVETYAWQSRYSLQYLPGAFGILIIYGIVIKDCIEAKGSLREMRLYAGVRALIPVVVTLVFMVGTCFTIERELANAQYRKVYFEAMRETALHIDDYTDEELNRIFEYNHGPGKVREAISTLKDNRLNIFR